jgi:hypothetical protein
LNKINKNIFITFLLLFCVAFSKAQSKEVFREAEDSLKVIAPVILRGSDDFVKYHANEQFTSLLEEALLKDKSFNYPFDSLITIARLVSPDNKFRIFNWHLPKKDGTYEYFAFIQAYNNQLKKYDLFKLVDVSDSMQNPEFKSLDYLHWYGAHYYKIIQTKYGGRQYYTLLGWDGNNKESCRKIIEVLSFNSRNKPVFGANFFKLDKNEKKGKRRIIFEYSASSSMSLKYEKQFTAKGKEKKKVIVFDRLTPQDPQLKGLYQFYVPETNTFDAFIFQNGKWVFMKDIDARNNTSKKVHKKQMEYNLGPDKKKH